MSPSDHFETELFVSATDDEGTAVEVKLFTDEETEALADGLLEESGEEDGKETPLRALK